MRRLSARRILGGSSGHPRQRLQLRAGHWPLLTAGLSGEGQASYDETGWKATSEAIQVLRVGYRFRPARGRARGRRDPADELWHLEAPRLGEDTHFKTLGAGVSAGDHFHLGRHFYAYPTAALTYDAVYSGTSSVQGREYEVPPVGVNGSVHLGWEL